MPRKVELARTVSGLANRPHETAGRVHHHDGPRVHVQQMEVARNVEGGRL